MNLLLGHQGRLGWLCSRGEMGRRRGDGASPGDRMKGRMTYAARSPEAETLKAKPVNITLWKGEESIGNLPAQRSPGSLEPVALPLMHGGVEATGSPILPKTVSGSRRSKGNVTLNNVNLADR